MIYQLAKTSPLLTGQVKINMIMNGNKVVDIQYVPISNHIPFNYNNPIDVLNYSHGDNVKALYNRISEQFFSEVTDPTLTVNQLHRYDTLRDDTHENTYEMGMKRLEYQRYKKQFEFFSPVWCDDLRDLDSIRFIINLANRNGRVMYSKEIGFDEAIKTYIQNIYPSLEFEPSTTINNDLLYINFNEVQSHIKGLHVESGSLKTIDTSYIVNNLLAQERPVLETDNMLVSLFSQNKTICTQLFNFNFVFDVEDFLPINLLEDLILERVNIYVDVYNGDKKAEVKDIYSNYEFIPKYDIHTGKYSDSANVLDYLEDNKSIELINKNKLTQGTFHWVLENNKKSIFNLYNGFAPLNNGKENCTSISNDAPDMFTDEFNSDKNPLGIFKVFDASNPNTSAVDFLNLISDDNNYTSLNIKNIKTSNTDYTFFGNVLINNKKLLQYIQGEECKIMDLNNIETLQCCVVKIPFTYNIDKVKGILFGKNYDTYFLSILKENRGKKNEILSDCNFLSIKPEIVQTLKIKWNKNNTTSYVKSLRVILFTKDEDDVLKTTFSFSNFYDRVFTPNQKGAKGSYENFNGINYTMNFLSGIFKCAKLPNDILFEKSVNHTLTNSPSKNSTEVELLKIDKFVELYRYDSKLLPMFIDLDEPIFKNYLYWCKQYNRTIQNELNGDDIDDISTYSKFALKKFNPLYKSIGYYVLNPTSNIHYEKSVSELTPVNYTDYYLSDNEYRKEISWYKNNLMIYLPTNFSITIIKPSNEGLTDDDIINELCTYLKNDSEVKSEEQRDFIKYYIKDLYLYTFKYDYLGDKIDKQIFEIKFTLK